MSVNPTPAAERVLDRASARRWRARQPGRVVFTNGVFDLLHAGHIVTLEGARALGDVLVVGVNSDRSARRLAKGAGRPFVPAPDRALLVAALRAVDCVVLFEEDTPASLIADLDPHVLVKGGDYDPAALPGRDSVLARGGDVTVIPLLPGRSTTALVERIRGTT
jgi:rfaE bifunctional protein nucleotidyltransferase chain/domain